MNPYQALSPRSFWRSAVAEPGPADIGDLWTPKFPIGQDDVILTAGSCFAGHIGRALLEHGLNWRDAEPAPPGLTREERGARGYGVFSFRTGNIYTAALLRQWFGWATGDTAHQGEIWEEDGRLFDPFRPAVEPGGYASPDDVLAAREVTLTAIREGLADASCLVFTMGLTEAWQDATTGAVYPACPGTVRGTFDPARHVLRNFGFAEVHEDLAAAIALARAVNPELRVLLTVSPQPLTATATGAHALAANGYTKSVLRAVTGQLAHEHAHVDYFPSYELITGAPFGSAFFEPNLRTVTAEGVAFVMRHFLTGLGTTGANGHGEPSGGEEFFCDDAVLDYYTPG
ncbi:GSCFA domain-containing protein [Amycolatopsis sp. CA-230715]|uniref:GSCFA domain-containing protein n=1 Tax=Amycolatopsis sp. CA-230715 TaxID=2745196 RepID=UPI001C028C53|nr:GSCFA domain-containing protein [Amycolatopsis sp. CA-230715]QWF85166.1 hypothetical protein HUW46_08620 [Amycolatopsis sp. CA-230715]